MKTGISLFVYNRPEHTRKVLDGLKKNNVKKLYIFADGLKREEHRVEVEETRKLIEAIDWCETEIIKSDKNKGLAESIVYGIDYVLDRHERVIVLEDDCVPTPNYIEFMERNFEKYENSTQVMSVSGYSWPVTVPQGYAYDIYFVYRISSWGWGTWRRAWKLFNRNKDILNKIMTDYEMYIKVNRAGRDLLSMLQAQVLKGIDSWAIYWAVNVAVNDGICINPVESKINNIGFDNSGIHMSEEDEVFKTTIDKEHNMTFNLPADVIINGSVNFQLENLLFYTVSNERNVDRLKKYYSMLNKWIENLQCGRTIAMFLQKKNIKSVAIYGMGAVGKSVYEEIKDTSIEIVSLVDKTNIDTLCKTKADAIIVTPIYDFEKISNSLRNLGLSSEIISLNELINY